jgi:hypothetical protein
MIKCYPKKISHKVLLGTRALDKQFLAGGLKAFQANFKHLLGRSQKQTGLFDQFFEGHQ